MIRQILREKSPTKVGMFFDPKISQKPIFLGNQVSSKYIPLISRYVIERTKIALVLENSSPFGVRVAKLSLSRVES